MYSLSQSHKESENTVTDFKLLRCKMSFPELGLLGILFLLKLPELSSLLNLSQGLDVSHVDEG